VVRADPGCALAAMERGANAAVTGKDGQGDDAWPEAAIGPRRKDRGNPSRVRQRGLTDCCRNGAAAWAPRRGSLLAWWGWLAPSSMICS
jgi:hypothetical protein